MENTTQVNNLIQRFDVGIANEKNKNVKVETIFKNTINKHQQLCVSLENDNCKKHDDIIHNDMNILEKRDKMWGHLNTLYINNTDEQQNLYNKIKYNKNKLEEQKKELLFLKEKYRNTKMGNSTHERNIDINKYERSKHNYYINLYITILLINIGLICIMFLINYKIISPTMFYLIVIVVYLLLILYIIYYVYYSNYDRDYFYWDKFLFGNPDDDSNSCPVSLTADELAAKKFNDNANENIKNFINNNSTNTVPKNNISSSNTISTTPIGTPGTPSNQGTPETPEN